MKKATDVHQGTLALMVLKTLDVLGPLQCNALLSRDPAVFVQPCRLTIALIQIGAKGDVQPFDTG